MRFSPNIVSTFALAAQEMGKFLKIKVLFLLLVGLALGNQSKADHISAGSISWECISSGADAGKFRFYLHITRDCSSTQQIVAKLLCENEPSIGQIDMTLIDSTDISPPCGADCGSASPTSAGLMAELTFASDPIAINVTPPAGGLVFSFEGCCFPNAQNIDQPLFTLRYLRAVMYPYNGQDLFPCYDSSPDFAAPANSLMCSGYQLRYASTAIDPDLDAVTYSWSPSLTWDGTSGVPATYTPGYTATNPLPSPLLGPYDTPIIDPNTGMIDYDTDPGLVGLWNMTVSAFSYRNGILISEITRELVVETESCFDANQVPQPNGAANTSIVVNAGDLVTFDIGATDPDMPNGVAQNVTMSAFGNMFSGDFTDPNNCLNAPCATLTNVPPVAGVGGVTTQFNWQTDCSHLTEFNLSSYTYDFVFRFEDDHCPIPGVSYATVSVTVLGDELLPSPEPRCVSVIDNDNIQIEWVPVTPVNPMPAVFEYVIEHSTSPTGPFTPIGTETNIGVGSFIHSTGMASNPSSTGPNYYHVWTRSGCLTDPAEADPLYTISSIYLDVTNNGSTIDLNWNHVVDPPLPSSNGSGQGWYNVFERNPSGSGTWVQVHSGPDLSYTRPVSECNDIVDFKVELSDQLGCTSISNIWTESLANNTPPGAQPLDSVSVAIIGPDTLPILGWPVNSSLNVVSYTVQWSDTSASPPIYINQPDVLGYNNTSFVYDLGIPTEKPECFRVYATNDCPLEGSPSQRQCTILLDVELETCEKTNHLTWTPYINWTEGVRQYEILAKKDLGPELKIGIVDKDSLHFAHQNLQLSATYCYRVRAIRDVTDRRVSSTSNEVCQEVFISKIPEYNYAYSTTVPHNEKVLHQFFIDNTAGITKMEVHRGQSPDTTNSVGTVEFDPLERFYEFSDHRARPNIRAYYYRTVVYDECDQPMDTSNHTRTIYLEAEAFADRTNVLTWSEYEGWPTGIMHYNIYRDYLSSGEYEYLATVPTSTLTYTDNVLNLWEGEGNFCYYIEAVQEGTIQFGPPFHSFSSETISTSNKACAPQHPNIFVPNAFAPNGRNTVFQPEAFYVDYQSYVFTVFDRFGGHIMRTLDKNVGWDGTLSNGMLAAQGVYAYTIEYETAEGVTGIKTGTVYLHR